MKPFILSKWRCVLTAKCLNRPVFHLLQVVALSLLVFFGGYANVYAQHWDFKGNKSSVTIPIEIINHIITIPVQLNGEELRFILDTGVKETLLFGNIDSVVLHNVTSINFNGLGISEGLKGLLSLSNVLVLGDSALIDHRHDLYVVVDSSVNLSKNIGIPIHGILGSHFFSSHIVRIDYVKKKLQVFKSLNGIEKMLQKYTVFKMDLLKDRPFVAVDILTGRQEFERLRMLVDLGNSDPLMLFTTALQDYMINTPYVYEFLGQGFNGDIYGKRSRIAKVSIGRFSLNEPFVSYPDTNSYNELKLATGRVGSIGNQVMSRFDVVFNYTDSLLYLKKNRLFADAFNIDMSGLEIRHEGFTWVKNEVPPQVNDSKMKYDAKTVNLGTDVTYQIALVPSYVVYHVRKDSPADLAGIRIGDVIYKINGSYAGKIGLEKIRQKLQVRNNYGVSLEVKRDGELRKFRFALIDPILLK
ncbi:PDZ domain-containing protein [Sphingobacterium faecale]|uniref:PDZ domain-containing protein n=1 Tax=Sphingobacterium faecale TaxID=2803775 RepID=A0ABS1R1N0_9SPHI|nr:PDZ domain-containing protein [Sphingobacterium faecale]MBL1408598.1 PDZ domain-containing protein [Sphingobacterium faecale]